ncbi:hypothetical protein WMO64_14930 [Pseudoflavonifractor sp. CLA-AP-H29]|uniref:ABC transporter permease n=1 Tax=Pseudoflavonifractor intestinihominis TaxID=3133171 RepID=A0ABV1EBT5_9FIRM
MTKFLALVSVNLRATLNAMRFGSRRKGNKAERLSGFGALVLLAVLGLYISGVYSFTFGSQLAPLGMINLIILIMPVIAVSFGLMFTIFAAQGVVFGGKDNDLMLSMPVSPFSLMLSRTLALYVENLVFTVFVLGPAGVAYLVFGGAGGAGFFVVLMLGAVLLSALPTLFSLLVGYVLAWVSSKFLRRGVLSTLLYLVFFLLLMAVIMRLSFAMGDLSRYAAGLQDAFTGWGLPFLLLEQAACEGNLLSLLALAGLCLVTFFLVVWLFAGRYKKIVTSMGARKARSDYKLERLSASGHRAALLKKELKRFFGSPAYFINSGFGLILLAAGGVACLVFRGQVEEFLALVQGLVPVVPVLALMMGFFLSTVLFTAPSISLEGRQLWILKEAPVSCGEIFLVKAGVQMLVTLPCLLVGVICAAVAVGVDPGSTVVLLVLGALFSGVMAQGGLLANLFLPKLDAPNDTVVVKQSASVLVTMFGSWVLLAIFGFGYVFVLSRLGETAGLLIVAAVCALLDLVLWRLLATVGVKLFRGL